MLLLPGDVLIRTINIDRKSPRGFHFSLMPPKLSVRPAFRGISFALLVVCLSHLPSCEKSNVPQDSGAVDEGARPEATERSQTGNLLPHEVIERAYRHLHRNVEESVEFPPYQRGDLLVSTGGVNGPEGTVVHPVKFEGFPVPFYFHQDEFGDWRFWVEKHYFRDSLGVPAPPNPEAQAKEQKEQQTRDQENRNRVEEERILQSVRRKAEEEANMRKEAEHLRKRQSDEETDRKRSAEFSRLDGERIRRERAEMAESNRLGAEERMRQREEQDQTLAREIEETRRKLGQASEPSEKPKPDEAAEKMPTSPSPKEVPLESKVSPSPDKALRSAEAKAELAALESKITSERQRFQQATDTINRLTNYKKTPVKEGSAAYRQCMEASRIIQEVEQKAPGMTTEKIRLTTLIAELEKE
jgi:hypothetical protein